MGNISRKGVPEKDAERLRELIFSLGRQRCLRDPIAATVEEMQLTPPQIHALLWLGREGALTMGELAHRLGITEKTITGVVDRLEREGRLQRERNEVDRRVVRVKLTRKGQTAYQEIDSHMREKIGQVLALLDAEDRAALFRLFDKLLQRLTLTSPAERGQEEAS